MNKILLAVLAGVGIGMLLAPDKGSATRKKLTGKFNDLKDQAQDSIDDLADNAKDAINSARRKAKSAFN
jgi:gas vesicle protein